MDEYLNDFQCGASAKVSVYEDGSHTEDVDQSHLEIISLVFHVGATVRRFLGEAPRFIDKQV